MVDNSPIFASRNHSISHERSLTQVLEIIGLFTTDTKLALMRESMRMPENDTFEVAVNLWYTIHAQRLTGISEESLPIT